MTSFSHVAKQKISSDDKARYELFDIGMDGATLIVAPATRSNKAYQKDHVKLMAPQQRRASGGMTAEFIDNYRRSTLPLYAKHIIKGWEKIVDAEGKPAPFNEENSLSFLQALPLEIMDALAAFCENASNFAKSDDVDVAALAKN